MDETGQHRRPCLVSGSLITPLDPNFDMEETARQDFACKTGDRGCQKDGDVLQRSILPLASEAIR